MSENIVCGRFARQSDMSVRGGGATLPEWCIVCEVTVALDCPPIPWVLGNLDLFTLHPTHASGRWGETVGSGPERPPEVWCAATLRAY